jgi:hypothetical protein
MREKLSYRQGRIVFAYLRSSVTGKMQQHPAVILDRDTDITQPGHFDPRRSPVDNVVYVAGVSTKYKSFDTAYVRLPYAPDGHAVTKLHRDCAVIIGWYQAITIPDDVIGFGGDVPAPILIELLHAVRKDLAKTIGREIGSLRQLFEELFGVNGS